jgi:hypothetical protein
LARSVFHQAGHFGLFDRLWIVRYRIKSRRRARLAVAERDVAVQMTDVELTRALERGEVPNEGFHHADHLRVALVYLNEAPTVTAAIERLASTLRAFATSVGKPDKYSQATTEFWMYQLAAARALRPEASADTLFGGCPRLLDKNLILAYYSPDASTLDPAASSSHPSSRSVSREPA